MSQSKSSLLVPLLLLILAAAFFFRMQSNNTPNKPKPEPVAPGPTAIVMPEDSTQTPDAPPFPAGSVFSKEHFFIFAVYFLNPPVDDPVAFFKSEAAKRAPELHLTERENLKETDKAPEMPFAFAKRLDAKEFAPPDGKSIEHFGSGLSKEQAAALPASREALVMHFVCGNEHALRTLAQATDLAEAIAKKYGGLIWDEETRQVFSTDFWKKYRTIDTAHPEALDVHLHVTIHFYRQGDGCRMVTLGMRKFGLPDVVIQRIAERSARSAGSLINLTCQTLWEQGKLDQAGHLKLDIKGIKQAALRATLESSLLENAKRTGMVYATESLPEEGDAINRQMEISGVPLAGQPRIVAVEALLSEIFGSKESLIHAERDDHELNAARDRARERINALAPKFQKGIPPKESLMVKAPFRTDSNGVEWMWIDVTKWEKDELTGILGNEPFEVKGLKAGATVKVKQDTLFDYLYMHADGTEEGNETSVILEKREKAGADK